MQSIFDFVVQNSAYVPWMIFLLILLAGLNLPISIDVIMVFAAFFAANLIPEHTLVLFISVLFGTYFSAIICYWLGRKLGIKLLKLHYFSKILPKKRLKKVRQFYEKYGLLTLLIGRFIPFGVRNCIFITTGMSKANFRTFVFRDALASSLWVSIMFFIFYQLGHAYEVLLLKIKTLNLYIFLGFGVTVIAFVWYKIYNKKQSQLNED